MPIEKDVKGFLVDFGGQSVAGVKAVIPPSESIAPIVGQTATAQGAPEVSVLPGNKASVKFFDIELAVADGSLEEWWKKIHADGTNPQSEKRLITITGVAQDGSKVMTYEATDAFPCEIHAGAWNADSNEVAYKRVRFACSDFAPKAG